MRPISHQARVLCLRSGLRAGAHSTLMLAMLNLFGGSTGRAASVTSTPILVELFTSQGCSSCPPADRLLSQLAASDSSIVALAFHVDYWNYIGWTDPFSSSDWSERQRRYALELDSEGVYTPQLIVNGRRHGVGNDPHTVSTMLRQAARDRPSGNLEIEVTRSSDTDLSLAIRTRLGPDATTRNLFIWVAVVEDGLETAVARGENAHRTLRNDCVVRSLERVPETGDAGASSTAVVDIDIAPDWRRDRLSVAAFAQDSDSLHILAAAAVPVYR